jgi:hypothetical protein
MKLQATSAAERKVIVERQQGGAFERHRGLPSAAGPARPRIRRFPPNDRKTCHFRGAASGDGPRTRAMVSSGGRHQTSRRQS